MNYCKITTVNHPLSISHNNCLELFNTLIVNEGYLGKVPLFENSEIVINMDTAETEISKAEVRSKVKSMDLAFALKNHDSSKKRMLLVELKFRMNDLYQLKKSDLEEKVVGSCKLLDNYPEIYNRYVFIFDKNRLQEAISRLFRMVPKLDSKYIAIDIETLKAEYF